MIVQDLRGAYAGDWLLGQEMPFAPGEADRLLQEAQKAGTTTPGSVEKMGYQDPFATGGGGGYGDIGKYATQAGNLLNAGKQIANSVTGGQAGTGTATKDQLKVCKTLYDQCKTFISSTSNQSKYKTLMAARVANTAWKTYTTERTACTTKYKSGAFGAFKVGDTKGNAAAYAKYQECIKTAFTKYNAAVSPTSSDQAFLSTFDMAKDYVTQNDKAIAGGRIRVDSACTSASEKNLLKRLSAAGSVSTATWVVGLLVVAGAGFAAWKLL